MFLQHEKQSLLFFLALQSFLQKTTYPQKKFILETATVNFQRFETGLTIEPFSLVSPLHSVSDD